MKLSKLDGDLNSGSLQYFGSEDFVINTAAHVHDHHEPNSAFQFAKNGFRTINRRYFSVQSIKQSEVLTLNLNDLDHMKRDFPNSSELFYQKMMQQTKNLLKDHLATLQSNRTHRYTIKQFRSPVKGESQQ